MCRALLIALAALAILLRSAVPQVDHSSRVVAVSVARAHAHAVVAQARDGRAADLHATADHDATPIAPLTDRSTVRLAAPIVVVELDWSFSLPTPAPEDRAFTPIARGPPTTLTS